MDLSGVSEPCQSGSCVLHTAVIVVTSALIICVNLINIIIIPRSLNISRTYGKYFMLSLACADLGVGLIVTPFSILPSVHGYWMYGAQWCTFLAITVAALCSISIFSIMCVCIDRYIHIQHALRYDEILSKRKCLITVAVIWIGTFGIFTLHKVFSGNYYFDHKSYICTINFPRDWIFTLFIIFTVVTPAFVVITSCTFKIYAISRRHVNEINALERQCQVFTIPVSSLEPLRNTRYIASGELGSDESQLERDCSSNYQNITDNYNHFAELSESNITVSPNSRVSKWKALKINLTIVVSFTIAWIPYSIIQVIMGFYRRDAIPQTITFIIMWLAFANSFWNFVVYFVMNKHFRVALYKYCRSLIRRTKVHPL